jgi:hypothetical protein
MDFYNEYFKSIVVIISRIEYQLQGIVLSKEKYANMMSCVNKLVKHKASLSSSTPNFLLYDKDIYGLIT